MTPYDVHALELTRSWPVDHVAAAVLVHDEHGSTWSSVGDTSRVFDIASITKVLASWAVLIAVEEGIVSLDQPVGQPGCTLAHVLSHAGGYGFDGSKPLVAPGRRRIYSNPGIELAAQTVSDAAGMAFVDYLSGGLFEPLGMSSTQVPGSPAWSGRSTVGDLCRFLDEVIRPTLLSPAMVARATTEQFPGLSGIVPGVGRYDPCPWGFGFEVRGTKSPHWTGGANSTSTFGHFGGAGTFIWVDPAVAAHATVACVALTDRRFDEWSRDALRLWPEMSDAVVAEATAR